MTYLDIMFLGWIQLFFPTDFRNALFIVIETQINNKNETTNLIKFLTKCSVLPDIFLLSTFTPKNTSMIPQYSLR